MFGLRPASLCLALTTLAACGPDPLPTDTLAAADTSDTLPSDDASSTDSSTTDTPTSETSTTETSTSSDSNASTDTSDADCLAELDNLYTIAEAARVAFLVEQAQAPLHRCPHPTGWLEGGQSGITPSLGVICGDGPGQRCSATEGERGPGLYLTAYWLDNPVGSGMDFALLEPHCFHYDFEMLNALDGYGECTFRVSAYTDFLQTTYILAGVLDEKGMVLEPILVEEL